MSKAKRVRNDNRSYPRVEIARPVVLIPQSRRVLKAKTVNVSPTGIQLYCDRITAYTLHPSGRFITRENAPRVEVHFALPLGGGLAGRVIVGCRLIYLNLIPQGGVTIGMCFDEFQQGTRRNLDRFIEQSLIPA